MTTLSLCLAVAAIPGKDVVLCIGPDGHLAIESALNGRCVEGPCKTLGAPARSTGLNRDDSDCGACISCVDIPLAQGPVAASASVSGNSREVAPSPAPAAMSDLLSQRTGGGSSRACIPLACLSPPEGGASPGASSPILRL